MGIVNIGHGGDSDLLIDLLRRSSLLEELQEDVLDRRELQDRLDVSRATIHRHTRLLGEWDLIEKSNDGFRLTEVGDLVTETLVQFKQEALSTLQLAPILDAVQDAPVDIDGEPFMDATVTTAGAGDPYGPLRRFVTLVDEAERLRGVDTGAIAPLYLDEIHHRILTGMETDIVSQPAVIAELLDTYSEKYVEPYEKGLLRLRLGEELQFSVLILDGRVGIAVRKGDDSSRPVFADTDDPTVREWAEAVFETYKAEAVRMEQYSQQEFDQATATLRESG